MRSPEALTPIARIDADSLDLRRRIVDAPNRPHRDDLSVGLGHEKLASSVEIRRGDVAQVVVPRSVARVVGYFPQRQPPDNGCVVRLISAKEVS